MPQVESRCIGNLESAGNRRLRDGVSLDQPRFEQQQIIRLRAVPAGIMVLNMPVQALPTLRSEFGDILFHRGQVCEQTKTFDNVVVTDYRKIRGNGNAEFAEAVDCPNAIKSLQQNKPVAPKSATASAAS